MEIKNVLVKDIKYAPYNPRKISDEVLNKLKKSIEEFGYVEPIIVNKRTMHVVGGNQRLKVLRQLDIKEVQSVIVDLDDVHEKALNIALNKINGEWDLPALKDLLLEIDTGEIDIELTGFEMPEIEELMTQFFEEDPTLGRKKVEYQSEFSIEQELIEEIKKRKVFFTFSGGKDSSLTAFLMIPILREIKKDFELLFVDTGVELPGVAEYVVRFAGAFDAPLKILKSEKDFFQYYEKKKSFPSPFYRDCIGLFINSVVDKYIFANLEKEEEFLIIRGGREKQTLQKSKGEKFYKLQEGKREVCILNPLFDLAEEAFQKKLDQLREVFGLWEGYDMGFQRTACWCCPFQTKAQYEAIQKHLPLCWNILKRKALEWEIQPESTLYRMAKD